jgi:NADPH:quinone reductase-like Zn-dependent oxidoreductase
MAMMRAATYSRNGSARDVLSIVEVPKPSPAPGEVLVRIVASGVNPSDVKKRAGWRSIAPLDHVVTPHSDGAGVVEAVGDGVATDWIGRRVWIYNAQGGASYGADSPECGTAAEYAALPLPFVVPLPDAISFETGACLGVPACTAHYAVFCDGDVEGKTILVQGGAGAVGELAIQFAMNAGAEVIATVSSPAKAKIARQAGARHVIDRHAVDVATSVRAIALNGVDRIVEVDFAANAAIDAAVLKRGWYDRELFLAVRPNAQHPLLPAPVHGGHSAFSCRSSLLRKAIGERGLADINMALSRFRLRPTIASVQPFDQVAAAHELVEDANRIGNVVLRVCCTQ